MKKREQFENFSNFIYEQLKIQTHHQVDENIRSKDIYYGIRYKIYEEHYTTLFMQIYFHIINKK
jgi:hypothetical protein